MKTIGFLISNKENEKRRVLTPADLKKINNLDYLFFEKGYGKVLGYSDEIYKNIGVNIVDKHIIYEQNVICNLFFSIPDMNTITKEKVSYEGKTYFGWTIETVPKKEITDFFTSMKMTVIAWEEMFKNGRSVLWENNEIAGESAVYHAFLYYGRLPHECSVAVIGNGNAAHGAIRFLEKMGSEVTIYNRRNSLFLRSNIDKYDVIVNAVKWDINRKDRLIYKKDLKKMKKGSMIIDVTCNEKLEIETSYAAKINNPVYTVNGIKHYAVDHAPTIFWKTASDSISKRIVVYIDDLIEEKPNEVLDNATIIKDGIISDGKDRKFSNS